MSSACNDFRRRLEALLLRSETAPELTTLGWHEHLVGCDDCRELLQAEEALDVLLSGLPDPELPPDLAARLLRRLAAARAVGLDALLELDRVDAPPDLPLRTLAGLRAARVEARLDTLLDSLPEPAPPRDLARGVLRGLEPERRTTLRAQPARRGRSWAPALLAAAAAVLAIVGAYVFWPASPEHRLGTLGEDTLAALGTGESVEATESALPEPAAPDEELLASLDLLEDWELLNGEDVDLLLATLEAPDELLLEDTDESPALDAPASEPNIESTAPPKRG